MAVLADADGRVGGKGDGGTSNVRKRVVHFFLFLYSCSIRKQDNINHIYKHIKIWKSPQLWILYLMYLMHSVTSRISILNTSRYFTIHAVCSVGKYVWSLKDR